MDPYTDYDGFAEVYDRHWADFAMAIRPVLDRLALADLPDGAHILDLCCGTGQLAASLTDRFVVTGVDASPAMIAIAEANAREARFMVADARDFTLPDPVDAAVCTFDSLNHIMGLDGLRSAFEHVRAAVVAGRPFVFDLNMHEGFEERWRGGSFDRDEAHFEIEGSWDPETGLATITITVDEPIEGTHRTTHAEFTQRAYTESDVRTALSDAGFTSVEVYDGDADLGFGGVGRAFFVAR